MRARTYDGFEELFPDAQKTADDYQLAEVIRGVIGDKEKFAQVGLSASMRNPGSQIDAGVRRHLLQRSPVCEETGNALIPRPGGRRRRRLRPVVVRPLHLFVLRVPAEVEDVVLRTADVLEQLPRRV